MESNERKYVVACLAGSMKHFKSILEYAETLSNQGWVVLMPFQDHRDPEIVKRYRDRLMAMQHQRIDMCDTLFVINPDGYIGESTQDEIDYAKSVGKEIRYMENPRGPRVVTLIGSGRFMNEFKEVETYLTLKGDLVFTPAIFTVSEINGDIGSEDHETLDKVHRQKMKISDEVIVINPGGYVGKDTQEEIDWAVDHGLKIIYYTNIIKEMGGNKDAKN